jgi:hypothetical protein
MKFVCDYIVSSIGQTDRPGPYLLMNHVGRKLTVRPIAPVRTY